MKHPIVDAVIERMLVSDSHGFRCQRPGCDCGDMRIAIHLGCCQLEASRSKELQKFLCGVLDGEGDSTDVTEEDRAKILHARTEVVGPQLIM
jgi:hypothetical protein